MTTNAIKAIIGMFVKANSLFPLLFASVASAETWRFDEPLEANGALVCFDAPRGAFQLDVDFEAGPLGQADNERTLHCSSLFDCMRQDLKQGFEVTLRAKHGEWSAILALGFGDEIVFVKLPRSVRLSCGDHAHFMFRFMANGLIACALNDERLVVPLKRSGPLAHIGKRQAAVGRATKEDGVGYAFNGRVKSISVTDLGEVPFGIRAAGPLAHVRGAKGAKLSFAVENLSGVDVSNAAAVVSIDGMRSCELGLGALKKGSSARLVLPFETRVKPGWRNAKVAVRGVTAGGKACEHVENFKVGVGPRRAERMQRLIDDSNQHVARAAELGFTRCVFGDGGGFSVGRAAPDSDVMFEVCRQALDEATMAGVEMQFGAKGDIVLPPGKRQVDFERHDAEGKTRRSSSWRKEELEIGDPGLCAANAAVWRAWARAFVEYPSFACLKPFSEFRDGAFPSFGGGEAVRYQKETGRTMPAGDPFLRGCADAGRTFKKYPSRVIPDDDPALRYLSWYWHGGDGWPRFLSAISDAVRDEAEKAGRRDITVTWDPCVRCPPCWGSGGNVEEVSQWVYPNPEPMSVAGPAEEVLAMTSGQPGQKPFIAIQLMAYRSLLAPADEPVQNAPEWAKRFPRSRFLAQPDDAIVESVWSALAKPVCGCRFYPRQVLLEHPAGSPTGYVFSNPTLPTTLRRLFDEIIAPLGPTLLKVGREKPDVAVFENFTSVVLGGGEFGMGWHAAPVTMLQRARLDPMVVYEDMIVRGALDGVRVVYAPESRCVSASILSALKGFRARGGILICDSHAPKSIERDFDVDYVPFGRPPAMDYPEFVEARAKNSKVEVNRIKTLYAKRAMIDQAEKLRQALRGRYQGRSDSSSAEIVTYNRRWHETDYLFAVNDKRTFGEYVGPWGRMMEKGESNEGWVSMRDPDSRVKAVYELSRGGEVPFVRDGSLVKVPIRFETCDGRILAFLSEKIEAVDLRVEIKDGNLVAEMHVLDGACRAVDAALPVEIRIHDAAGQELDGAGYLCAEGGTARVVVPLNADDARGGYRIECRDRASGLSKSVVVAAEAPARRAARFVNDICLPSQLWMLDGVQNEIFCRPFVKRWRPYDDYVRFSMPKTCQFFRRLGHVATIEKPVDGTFLTVDLVNGDEFDTVKTLHSVLHVAKPGIGESEVVAQILGDSYTHGCFFWDALVKESYVPKLKLVGLRRPTEGPQCHEGRGGWSLASYFKVPKGESTSYHGFLHPTDGRYWGDAAFWKMAWRCVNNTQPKGFSPTYQCEYFGDAAKRFDPSTGYLRRPSPGDYQYDSGKKGMFKWNGMAKKWERVDEKTLEWSFDYGKYLSMWELQKPQFLFEMLGVNDFRDKIDADYSEWARNLEALKSSYLKAVPEGRFVICIPCSSFGSIDNFAGDFVPRQNASMWRFRNWLIETYDRREKDGYYLLDTALCVDSDYGYLSATNRPLAKPYAKYSRPDRLAVQYGNPHPYLSYSTMGIPLAAFIQYFRDCGGSVGK